MVGSYWRQSALQQRSPASIARRVREVTDAVSDRAKDLEIFALLLARLERERWQTEKLRDLRTALETEGQAPSKEIRKLVILIEWLNSRLNAMFAAIAPRPVWSTQFAFAIEEWRSKHGVAITRWLETVGEIEALCSLSAYAYEHAADPFPQMIEARRKSMLRNCVIRCCRRRNGPELPPDSTHDLQFLIISGSNMSGKSTLLRTIGVNVVLALAGAPVAPGG